MTTEQTGRKEQANKQNKQTERTKNSSFYKCEMRTAMDE
jgi:hypothetical protein